MLIDLSIFLIWITVVIWNNGFLFSFKTTNCMKKEIMSKVISSEQGGLGTQLVQEKVALNQNY